MSAAADAAAPAIRIAVRSRHTGLRAYLDAASPCFCPVAFVNFGEGGFHDFRVAKRIDACHECLRCADCGFEETRSTCPDAQLNAARTLLCCPHCRHTRPYIALDINALLFI